MLNIVVIGGLSLYVLILIILGIKTYGYRRYWDGFTDGQDHEKKLNKLFGVNND